MYRLFQRWSWLYKMSCKILINQLVNWPFVTCCTRRLYTASDETVSYNMKMKNITFVLSIWIYSVLYWFWWRVHFISSILWKHAHGQRWLIRCRGHWTWAEIIVGRTWVEMFYNQRMWIHPIKLDAFVYHTYFLNLDFCSDVLSTLICGCDHYPSIQLNVFLWGFEC